MRSTLTLPILSIATYISTLINVRVSLLSVFAISMSAVTNISNFAAAQQTTSDPQQTTQTATQKICSFDPVGNLLPPVSEQTNSTLSYLAEQGFIQSSDGSWVCYVNDSGKEGRYYTLFKVQQIDKTLVASSFLAEGQSIEPQDNRSLDFFMTLIQNHTKTNQGNLQSIRRYIEAFITLVKQGKVKPSNRGYLFDQPSRAFIFYNPLIQGQFKGTAITINIALPQNLGSSPQSKIRIPSQEAGSELKSKIQN